MFKLESYIAPILLSYVDKYIKNFRLEDSQVSLWGGAASFQNLDLRLEVLEEELQSPFSFISGHIHELLIYVPWTKLTSEPITITINTIECVLKLKDSEDTASEGSPSRDVKNTNRQVEAPPNYVQLLINKITNNIRIYCNNLILKYVEEDIVLSMNVKHLKVESCNENWEAAFTDPSSTQVTIRKTISVNDLTVCLDKRSASGKIDFYQEPMLYRCSMTMHFLRTYHASTSNKASLTRLDIYCNNMEFSITQQQVPMFYRLLILAFALQQKQLKSQTELAERNNSSLENKDSVGSTETWTGWVWSYVSTVLPTQWDEDLEEQQVLNQSGHIIQIGSYVDNASLTFKVSDLNSHKKIRYFPLLNLQIQGIYSEVVMVGRKWTNMSCGISEILLVPVGTCSCSHLESPDSAPYLQIGSQSTNYKSNSLFDAEAIENAGRGQYRSYNTNWEFHMYTNTEEVMLERSPAFACNYLYQMELPEDCTSEALSDLGSNLEYSNMAEKAIVRICCGSLKLRICSGIFHRISSLQMAASIYDYPPYYTPKVYPPFQELLPPSEEDFDALNEFIPSRTTQFRIVDPVIEIQFMDHPFFEPTKGNLFKRPKKHSTVGISNVQLQKLPKLTLECKLITISIKQPMYPNRLVYTTCQLPEPPEEMFEACFSKFDVNVVGLCSRLILKPTNQTTLVVPFNLYYDSRAILIPQYWHDSDVTHSEINFQSENVTFNCTKAKLIVVSHLIGNVLKRNTDGLKNLKYTSLLYDASKDYAMPYLELYIEGVKFKRVHTNSTVSIGVALSSVKAFVFESTETVKENSNAVTQQVLFLSGPEPKQGQKATSSNEEIPLFTATLQYPQTPDIQNHPSFLIFNLQEINVCVDPLVCKWLLYHPMDIGIQKPDERNILLKSKSFTDTFGSASENKRSNTQIESVHSSSDHELLFSMHHRVPKIEKETIDLQDRIYKFLETWHPVWKSMLLNGHISQCIIYFPMASISAVGSQGVEDAIKEAFKKKLVPNVMVITLPFANVHSAQKHDIRKHVNTMPVKLPEKMWSTGRSSFPWSMSISDLTCYSMESGKEISFLKKVSLNTTVDLSTKSDISPNKPTEPDPISIGCLSICVHIDVTPILISVSEAQMCLLASLIYGLNEFFMSLTPKKMEAHKLEALPPIPVASPSPSPTLPTTLENTSETLPVNESIPEIDTSSNSIKLTAWIQWTITKLSIELMDKTQVKLVLDVEDIVSSLDYQNVYLKLKSNIGSVSMQHFKRSKKSEKWKPGPFSGIVMGLREGVYTNSGFVVVTITRASCQHTYNLWGAFEKQGKQEKRAIAQQPINTSRYITEIVVNIQPIDFVLSLKTLSTFYTIIAPFAGEVIETAENFELKPKKQWFTNQTLPLAYLDCKEIRVFIPSAEFNQQGMVDDVYVLKVEKICLSPSVLNPICRSPIRPDIYRKAAQSRQLTVPGSELEDRQYQFDIVGMSLSTGAWQGLEPLLTIGGNVDGINENPALEWNNLKPGKSSVVKDLDLKSVVEKFDVSLVAAPLMLYRNEIVICRSSFELNFVTDIYIDLSLDNVKLAFAIAKEVILPESACWKLKTPEITFPYSRFDIFREDIESELTEFYKDSGIDTSEIRSVLSSKSQIQTVYKSSTSRNMHLQQPLEILITAGKITLCLYQQLLITESVEFNRRANKSSTPEDEDHNYEASAEESVDEVIRPSKRNLPLLFLYISQPNAYLSLQQFVNTAQISCFDFGIKLHDPKTGTTSHAPQEKNFPIELITTRQGSPDLLTGIPPAFFTIKYTKEYAKNATFHLELSRPTKISLSLAKLTALLALPEKFNDCFIPKSESVEETSEVSTFRRLKERMRGIEMINVTCKQLVLHLETEHNIEASLIIGKVNNRLFLGDRPEKMHNFATLECITFSTTCNNQKRLLLNPWTVSLEMSAFVETWQNTENAPPQIHLCLDTECLILNVSPEHILCLSKVIKEITEFTAYFPSSKISPESVRSVEKDQHYKDDLRAGAFQFIEANSDEEMPLPYQVKFWNSKELSAMAWKYPQPRALTKVRVFPVPLDDQESKHQLCKLEYWSEHHCAFLTYAHFKLSESEVCYLDFPKEEPQRAVAYIWRVLLINPDEEALISARALAACMRVDSYFNKMIIPNLTIVVYVSKLEVGLFSHTHKDSVLLPEHLSQFAWDGALPEPHNFLKLTLGNLRFHLATWSSFEMLFLDFSTMLNCTVLDYNYLREQPLLLPFSAKFDVNLGEKLEVRAVSQAIQFIFSPTITHTLSVNVELWSQFLQESSNHFVTFTRFVVCNDTDLNLRFGQASTDEEVLLGSRSFHMYSWRSIKKTRFLRVAFEDRDWMWSNAFQVDYEGTQIIPLDEEDAFSVVVMVKVLSPTQKLVVIGGQFIIANMLQEHFEFKLIPESKDEKEMKKGTVLKGRTIAASMFIHSKINYHFRLRFYGLESAWTGDIPLKEHTKGAQPWLVKVPLQERGQFLSIWCRIVVQDSVKGKRILAMLWPLFMVKSHLPVSSKIHVETPTLNVHLDSTVKGKGELQQLYCPGTIDHSHQLTFKLENDTSITDPYLPLNYSLVDQQQFFKKGDKENINDIIENLRSYNNSKWPYFGEDYENIEWIVDEQPQTTIQVRYQNASPYSSALMVELLPWCLLMNTFGCPISINVNDTELCKIAHYGIVAPPKLDDTFHLGIDTGSRWCYSGPLQLAASDWSQTFYMPKISGTLSLEGAIKTAIKCDIDVSMISITSCMFDDIRLLKVCSTHVFSNYLSNQIHMACFAVPDGDQVFDMPKNIKSVSFSVAPQLDKRKSGISIMQWHSVTSSNLDTNYALYVSFAFEYKAGWSCPVRVDDNVTRRSFAVNTIGQKSVPLVLVSQESKGQTYLSLYHDDCPQTLIENKSSIPLLCAQSLSDNSSVAAQSAHFNWFAKLNSGTSVYYTMPFVAEKFPDLPQSAFAEKIAFAVVPKKGQELSQWSIPISITNDLEQFVKIPSYGDVRLVVKVTTFTTLLTIESVSQIEISAIDIRGRLSQHEMETRRSSNSNLKSNITKAISFESDASSSQSISKMSLYRSLFVPTIPKLRDWDLVEMFVFIQSFSIAFLTEDKEAEEQMVARIIIDNITGDIQQSQYLNLSISASDIQFDNNLYSKGSYDFPVVLINQVIKPKKPVNIFEIDPKDIIENSETASLSLKLTLESWRDESRQRQYTGVNSVIISLSPISMYIEDLYINTLLEYFKSLTPAKTGSFGIENRNSIYKSISVNVPELVFLQSTLVVRPLNLKSISIEPLSILLSVHSSVKMYIALDQSPLYFGRFERRRLLTTPYRLGHAMTMHYLSGAIFGAGWVVSSLELLGSPSGLARAMGTGLRDFVNLPYQGLVLGPWAFLAGVTHGSASLMKHVTAGTLQSVTKLASSVARNLDRLTLDEEHLRRTEEQRRHKPQGLTQGFMLGLTGLGISLLGAVGGIAHHPLQSLMADGASPRSLAAGFGLGLVGVLTKPLSGAAELVALTGQGLLQGAGWNPLPEPRLTPENYPRDLINSLLKYQWKLLHSLSSNQVLFASDATFADHSDYNGVALILTEEALVVASLEEDVIKRVVGLSQIQVVRSEINENDPTLLVFKIVEKVDEIEVVLGNEEQSVMDPTAKARVADYVRSTANLLQISSDQSELSESAVVLGEEHNELLSFYVNPQIRNYFICLFALAKQQHNHYNFPVL